MIQREMTTSRRRLNIRYNPLASRDQKLEVIDGWVVKNKWSDPSDEDLEFLKSQTGWVESTIKLQINASRRRQNIPHPELLERPAKEKLVDAWTHKNGWNTPSQDDFDILKSQTGWALSTIKTEINASRIRLNIPKPVPVVKQANPKTQSPRVLEASGDPELSRQAKQKIIDAYVGINGRNRTSQNDLSMLERQTGWATSTVRNEITLSRRRLNIPYDPSSLEDKRQFIDDCVEKSRLGGLPVTVSADVLQELRDQTGWSALRIEHEIKSVRTTYDC
ncbi:hypothetical protein DL93DRAFT_560593 [Clavulina sp. PMI_390]|nr:hypothetical protein DL93DRAFT_560593 [Clavulina sp. PMI_390]